jgi:hypothetical protein
MLAAESLNEFCKTDASACALSNVNADGRYRRKHDLRDGPRFEPAAVEY